MAGTITVDTIQSDTSYASTLNVASKINFTAGMQIGGQDATFGGMRNRIINGDMRIDQRNAGSASNNSTTFNYVVDRFRFTSATTNTATLQRVADAPSGSGFVYSAKVICNTGQSLSAGSYHNFGHPIEGFNVGDLMWGTANAKPITLSFWAKSSLVGTFGGNIANYGATTRCYVFQYTISSANTWQKFTITIPGDTGGDWYTVANTNALGMFLLFSLGEGSNQQASSANTWVGSDYRFISGNIQMMTVTGATWQITGVQIEKGSVATEFEYRPYGQELALCQRYYWKMTTNGQNYSNFGLGYASSSTNAYIQVKNPVTMRTIPGSIEVSASGTIGTQFNSTVTIVPNALGVDYTTYQLTGSGMSANQCVGLFAQNNAAGYIAASAEF